MTPEELQERILVLPGRTIIVDKPIDFGATGDSITDDTEALRNYYQRVSKMKPKYLSSSTNSKQQFYIVFEDQPENLPKVNFLYLTPAQALELGANCLKYAFQFIPTCNPQIKEDQND